MHQKDQDFLFFTGFEAFIQGDYLIIGNIVIALVILGTMIHLLSILYEIFDFKTYKKMESTVNIIVNITVFFSLIIITFLGTFLIALGYVMIGLLVLSTYLRYLEQKKNE
jgi:succinate dehydrogenase/fumarate reductase cytochrome b subunit